MQPPPVRRICGTANLHIRNAPVRLTAMALFHCSSDSVSTVPSGVTAAATLTSVVSLPKASMVPVTAASALAALATSTTSDFARPPLSRIARATTSDFAGSISAIATAAPSVANSCAMAPPISPPPPLTSVTRPANLAPVVMSMHRMLQKAAVEDRRLRRKRRFHDVDVGQALGHLGVKRIGNVAIEAEKL